MLEAKTAPTETSEAGSRKAKLKEYTREEVSKHTGGASGVWVTYNAGVYDVTEFVEQHPGGDVILTAAGQDVGPFWELYQQHKEGWVNELLEQYRIGNLKEGEEIGKKGGEGERKELEDRRWLNEPKRSPVLCVRSEKPFNAEPPLRLLAAEQVTPIPLFYVRNHLPVPKVDPENYKLEICSDIGKNEKALTLNDLKTKFKKVEVAATIQCAGNRRNEMAAHKPVRGGAWDIGAISNAKWAGAPLKDVLEYAGVPLKEGHVHFVGLDKDEVTKSTYAASIPVDVLQRHDVLLAYEMNGEQLPVDHGYPIRAVVPGIVGARNVKWVGKIVVSTEECDSHWQKRDYKGFCPNRDWHNVNFDAAPAIQEMPVTSAICGYSVDDDTVCMAGYAWSGDGKGIIRVDVSVDGGKTWCEAELRPKEEQRNRVYDWTLWEAEVTVPKSKKKEDLELVCKAVDSAYNTQPDSVDAIWNLRGVLNNSWHKICVRKQST